MFHENKTTVQQIDRFANFLNHVNSQTFFVYNNWAMYIIIQNVTLHIEYNTIT